MLHRSTLDKASRPGLRFQGWKALPVGSKIAIIVLGLIALVAILAPIIAPYSPGATGLAETKTTSYIEGVGEVTASDLLRSGRRPVRVSPVRDGRHRS